MLMHSSDRLNIIMNIDKFGRGAGGQPNQSMIMRSQGLPRTSDNNYDVENLRLHNVGSPLYMDDAATKRYVDEVSASIRKQLDPLRESVRLVEGTGEKCDGASRKFEEDFTKIRADFDAYKDSLDNRIRDICSELQACRDDLRQLQVHVIRTETALISITSSSIENIQGVSTSFILETKQALEDIKLHLNSKV